MTGKKIYIKKLIKYFKIVIKNIFSHKKYKYIKSKSIQYIKINTKMLQHIKIYLKLIKEIEVFKKNK